MKNDNNAMVNFRLNLDNAEHLKIFRILENLDKKKYKSKTKFIMEAILAYADKEDEVSYFERRLNELEKTVKELCAIKQELEEMKTSISIEVMGEVMKAVSQSSFQNQGMMNPMVMQSLLQGMNVKPNGEVVQKEEKKVEHTSEVGVDSALEEMSLLFSEGTFEEG